MNWLIFEDKSVPFACDECDTVIKPHAKFYVCHAAGSLIIVHPDCKEALEKRLKELIQGN